MKNIFVLLILFSVVIFGCKQATNTSMEKEDGTMNIQLTGDECVAKGGEIVNTLGNPKYDKKLLLGKVIGMKCPCVCLKKEEAMMEKDLTVDSPTKELDIEEAALVTPDSDSDGVANARDNCPFVTNPNQADNNENGVGDACEDNYSSKVLAGTDSTKYLDFNKADYDKALKEKKKILLYFYASWCPICKREQPDTFAAFNEINDADLIGFRVNYRDSDTDADEENLAKEFGVGYQHTKVILKDGKRVGKFPDSWDKQRYLDELAKI